MQLLMAVLRLMIRLAIFTASVIAEVISTKVLRLWSGKEVRRRTRVGARNADASPRARVAVIGGGIAGSSCAWALQQDGFEAHLFEAADCVGGNAKTFVWPDGQRTGLSVLAWPQL